MKCRLWNGTKWFYIDLSVAGGFFPVTGLGNNKFLLIDKFGNSHECEGIYMCTELKDKNGVEIYEGDIVSSYNQENEIKFIEGAFRLIGFHQDKYKRNYDYLSEYLIDGTIRSTRSNFDGMTTTLEIIGNIKQHPELLVKE